MRFINVLFTYLLTYLLTIDIAAAAVVVMHKGSETYITRRITSLQSIRRQTPNELFRFATATDLAAMSPISGWRNPRRRITVTMYGLILTI